MRDLFALIVMSLVQWVCYQTGRILLPIASFGRLDIRTDNPNRVSDIVAVMLGALVWSAIAVIAILIHKHWS